MTYIVYAVALIVVMSSAPGKNEVIVFQFPTWEECQQKRAELEVRGTTDKRPGQEVRVDCRHDVLIALGPGDSGAPASDY